MELYKNFYNWYLYLSDFRADFFVFALQKYTSQIYMKISAFFYKLQVNNCTYQS